MNPIAPDANRGHGRRPADGVSPSAAWGTILSLCLFAAFRSRSAPWGMVGALGLLGAAACLAHGLIRARGAWREYLALRRPPVHAAAWLTAGVVLGISLAMAYRVYAGLSVLPARLGAFVLLAAAIGAVEELVYRGFVQTGLTGRGRFSGVIFASAGHAAYKGLLFAWRPEVVFPDLGFLVVATFLAGILLGGLREASGSLWPSIFAHAAFDIVLYGALLTTPWWVWG